MSPFASFSFSPAQPSDAAAIASLLASSWNTPFTALQFGTLDPQFLASAMAPRIAQQIASRTALTTFEVARSLQKDGQVVSVAQWSVHVTTAEEEDEENAAERRDFEQQVYLHSLPETCNKPLVLELAATQRNLCDAVMRGHLQYLVLDNLATTPQYRRRGLAAQLLWRGVARAEDLGAPVYLDTACENAAALGLYAKLGFEERGRRWIEDLGRLGGAEGEGYGVVGLVRMGCEEGEGKR